MLALAETAQVQTLIEEARAQMLMDTAQALCLVSGHTSDEFRFVDKLQWVLLC